VIAIFTVKPQLFHVFTHRILTRCEILVALQKKNAICHMKSNFIGCLRRDYHINSVWCKDNSSGHLLDKLPADWLQKVSFNPVKYLTITKVTFQFFSAYNDLDFFIPEIGIDPVNCDWTPLSVVFGSTFYLIFVLSMDVVLSVTLWNLNTSSSSTQVAPSGIMLQL